MSTIQCMILQCSDELHIVSDFHRNIGHEHTCRSMTVLSQTDSLTSYLMGAGTVVQDLSHKTQASCQCRVIIFILQ